MHEDDQCVLLHDHGTVLQNLQILCSLMVVKGFVADHKILLEKIVLLNRYLATLTWEDGLPLEQMKSLRHCLLKTPAHQACLIHALHFHHLGL
jgi:hypothetical protein